MNKICVSTKIDFADSTFKAFQISEENLITTFFESWDGKEIICKCKNAIRFSYKVGYVPARWYEILGNHSFLEKAISGSYVNFSDKKFYKMFQLEDIDDFPFIQVVAESITIIEK